MKATDLMIGDWVFNTHHNKNIQITPYDFFTHGHYEDGTQYITESHKIVSGNDFVPIPLTTEILEKNEFKEDFETNGIYWRPDCRKFCIVKELDTWYFAFRVLGERVDKSSGYICISECNYVHKLQHIMRLCEINKEIIL